MNGLSIFLHVLLILASFVLIASILLQSGKSAGLSGAIGGGAEQLWGKNKARDYDAKFDRITKISAIVFFVSATVIAYIQ
ncbi:MAG: preprotein translocase subunit SecG [Clostridiales bacterium]|nr:preprotein translocase subunit SecG [Clostridiales bacterium]